MTHTHNVTHTHDTHTQRYEHTMPHTQQESTQVLQCGEDAEDALICRSLSAKEPLIVGLFCET